MLDQITDEMLTIGIVVVGSLTALVLFAYIAIFINPQIAINPFPPPEVSPTVQAAAVATFPPTWTPKPTVTPTPPPTVTRIPTAPPFSTLGPTNTPIPIDVLIRPTVLPTETPVAPPPPAAPTFPPATSAPPPPPPPPTSRPEPLYRRLRMLGGSSCNWVGAFGFVYSASDQAMGGVVVRVHNDFGYTRDVTTGADGRWELFLDDHPRDDLATGRWHAAVVEDGKLASDEVAFALSTDCNGGIQRVQIDWQRTR